jgi:hypothetical protein
MAKPIGPSAREERLAAKLRENLHRRKTQARALGGGRSAADEAGQHKTGPHENDSGALSKPLPES